MAKYFYMAFPDKRNPLEHFNEAEFFYIEKEELELLNKFIEEHPKWYFYRAGWNIDGYFEYYKRVLCQDGVIRWLSPIWEIAYKKVERKRRIRGFFKLEWLRKNKKSDKGNDKKD